MAHRASNERPPSTPTRWKDTRIRRSPRRATGTAAAGARWSSRSKVNPRDRLTVVIAFRGGAECWYEVYARGVKAYFHGATALHDVLEEITQGGAYYVDDPKAYEVTVSELLED